MSSLDVPPARSGALDRLIDEAKRESLPKVSNEAWAAMESRLLAQLSAERSSLTANAAGARAPRFTRRRALTVGLGGGMLVAAAAALVLFSRVAPRVPRAEIVTRPAATERVGALRAVVGSGDIRIRGVKAGGGYELHVGDPLDVSGARAVFERPEKVYWLLEGVAADSRAATAHARVTSADSSLVVALDDGAVEAKVTPVPFGEAFAVDIAADQTTVRVAVHGTHLRVARSGTRITVDLTEGVVSIGIPPATGLTHGTDVIAPAHVEFDAGDLPGTLRVDYAPASVRAAIPLGPFEGPTEKTPTTLQDPMSGVLLPRPPLPSGRVADRAQPPTPGGFAFVDAGRRAVSSRQALAQAVRECASRSPPNGNVRASVSSSLTLTLNSAGEVEATKFDPPLQPDIQTCAGTAILGMRFDVPMSQAITVPIAFTY